MVQAADDVAQWAEEVHRKAQELAHLMDMDRWLRTQ
jgi:hypothetical protein